MGVMCKHVAYFALVLFAVSWPAPSPPPPCVTVPSAIGRRGPYPALLPFLLTPPARPSLPQTRAAADRRSRAPSFPTYGFDYEEKALRVFWTPTKLVGKFKSGIGAAKDFLWITCASIRIRYIPSYSSGEAQMTIKDFRFRVYIG